MSELEHIKPIIERVLKLIEEDYPMSEETEEKASGYGIGFKLCWKCRESIIQKFGEYAYFMPYQHCHHPEPEEKPAEKCWCEYKREDIFEGGIITERSANGFPTQRRDINYHFCPECGTKV